MNTETLTPTPPPTEPPPTAPAVTQPELIKPRTPHASFLDPTTIALLRARTNDPLVRALVLSKCNVWLPAGDLTFEAAIEHLEMNYTPPPEPPATQVNNGGATALSLDVYQYGTEHGTCRYAVSVSGSATINLSNEELANLAEDSEDMEDLLDRVRDYVTEEANEIISLDVSDGDGYQYDRYDFDEVTNRTTDFDLSNARFREAVMDALRTINPELLAELD